MHWSQRYIGQPYEQADCAAFAEQVQREVFYRDISLPSERAAGLRGQSQQIHDSVATFAARTETPQDGDGVLMVGRGHLNHIGIYCVINAMPYVLHSMKDAGAVCLHRVRDLASQGLPVEGFYKWLEVAHG